MIKKIIVHCDNCGRDKKVNMFQALGYYKRKCPACGAILINGHDLAVFIAMLIITGILYPFNLLARGKKKSFRVRLDDSGTYQIHERKEETHEKI